MGGHAAVDEDVAGAHGGGRVRRAHAGTRVQQHMGFRHQRPAHRRVGQQVDAGFAHGRTGHAGAGADVQAAVDRGQQRRVDHVETGTDLRRAVEIQNDLIAAARSLCGKEAGIACILGTGSNSGFWDGGRISAQIPPLGFWLGDEGSGGHLGKLLLLSYLHGQMPVEIRAVFEKRFGIMDRLTVLDKAYKQAFPNRWFASFSKFLFDHRRDAFCYSLIEQSFEAFISLYLKRYQEAPVVHFTGSVAFYYSDILKKILKKHGLNVGHISEGPMAGLCLYHKGEFWP